MGARALALALATALELVLALAPARALAAAAAGAGVAAQACPGGGPPRGAAAPRGEAAWREFRGPGAAERWGALWEGAGGGPLPEDLPEPGFPQVGVALSGGGFRAANTAAGVLSALDARDGPGGPASGLYQTAALATGISGGSWALSAASVDPTKGWRATVKRWRDGMEEGLIHFGTRDLSEMLRFWQSSMQGLHARPEGAPTPTMSDLMAPSVAFSFGVPLGTGQGPLAESDPSDPATWAQPLPITIVHAMGERGVREAVDTCREYGQDSEQGLWEWGVWDDGTFAPGFWGFGPSNESVLASSSPEGGTTCWGGITTLPWKMATAGAVWNGAVYKDNFYGPLEACQSSSSWVLKIVCMLLQHGVFRMNATDSEMFRITDPPALPVPEHPVPRAVFAMDGQPCEGIPIAPLLEPVRDLDVILAVDATSPWIQSIDDPNSFPEGEALQQTAFYALGRGLPFPDMPLLKDFVEEPEMLQKNTFFGCFNASVPAVAYVPHRNESYSREDVDLSVASDKSTPADQEEMFANGRAMVSGEGFQRCLLCVSQAKFLQRRSGRAGEDRSGFEALLQGLGEPCEGCLKQCWSGKSGLAGLASSDVAGAADPEAFLHDLSGVSEYQKINVTDFFFAILGGMERILTDPLGNTTFEMPEGVQLS